MLIVIQHAVSVFLSDVYRTDEQNTYVRFLQVILTMSIHYLGPRTSDLSTLKAFEIDHALLLVWQRENNKREAFCSLS